MCYVWVHIIACAAQRRMNGCRHSRKRYFHPHAESTSLCTYSTFPDGLILTVHYYCPPALGLSKADQSCQCCGGLTGPICFSALRTCRYMWVRYELEQLYSPCLCGAEGSMGSSCSRPPWSQLLTIWPLTEPYVIDCTSVDTVENNVCHDTGLRIYMGTAFSMCHWECFNTQVLASIKWLKTIFLI